MRRSVKRLLAALLLAVMPLGMLGCAQEDAMDTILDAERPALLALSADGRIALPFSDVPETCWYRGAVEYVTEHGLMSGLETAVFGPDESMTRGMLVTVLWRYAGQPAADKGSFTDVPEGRYFTQAVAWAAQNGVVYGVTDTAFEPESEITREQLAAILFRYAQQLGTDTAARGSLDGFADKTSVSKYASDAIGWAVAKGIISGDKRENGLFLDPQGSATRAQVASILMRFIGEVGGLPEAVPDLSTLFSFSYDGKDSAEFLSRWPSETTTEPNDGFRTIKTAWTAPDGLLRVTVEAKQYDESGALEWVARLENIGAQNTALVENFQIADLMLETEEDVTISYSKGTDIRADDFLFVQEPLALYGKRTFSPKGGRSSSGDCMPYFNLSSGGRGCFLAIGWSGQWETSFKRSSEGVRVAAGMEETHFVLYPNESVRTPSFAVLQWSGNEEESYNLWRAFMLENHTPKDENGDAVTLPLSNGAWGGDPEQNHRNTIEFISASGYDFDAYWIDAGWFGEQSRHSSDQYGDEWFKNAGDWYHNTTLYPNGLLPVSEAAEAGGMDFLLWFEPERAWFDSTLVQEHPEWFLKTSVTENTSYLFNMGNAEAREWMTQFISQKLSEYGVDIYRQDFNTDPLPYWQAADSADRRGVTEMKYIEGLYAYLDGLTAAQAGLILDNCAGGGRRLDYEILTRALPLFRSDYQCFTDYKTTPCQVQTDGLSHWVPLNGTCTQYRPNDTYSFRSNLAYAMQTPATDQSAWQKAMIAQFHQAQPFFTGEYYRVSSADVQSEEAWYAYQMHRADRNEGFLLAFRRENAQNAIETLHIHVPDGASELVLTDADTGESRMIAVRSGNDGRMELSLTIENPLESKLLFYQFT